MRLNTVDKDSQIQEKELKNDIIEGRNAVIEALRAGRAIDKPTFGSAELGRLLLELDAKEPVGSITLVGLCTDICVISNAMSAKAFLPEVPVTVDAACCAGVTPESHRNALSAMKMCQVRIENE